MAACALLVAAAAVGALLGLRDESGTAPAPSPTVAAPPNPPLPADPRQALATQSRTDATTAEALVGAWVPQLSAKKDGMVVDGRTYDASSILADHHQQRTAHPNAVLV